MIKRLLLLMLLALGLTLTACGFDEEYYEDEDYLEGDIYDPDEFGEGVEPESDDVVDEPGADPAAPVDAPAPPAEFIADYEPVLESADCPVYTVGAEVECGYMIVPENRTLSDSPEVRIAYAVVYPQGAVQYDAPLLHLAGGPGESMLLHLDGDPESFYIPSYAAGRVQVLIEQRGTGYSEPSLNCPEMEEGYDGAEADCHARLVSEGIDLGAYNTAENAADVADLVRALGYEQADLYGVSYGTRLGLAVIRDYPDVVRSAVLDSVFPPVIDLPAEEVTVNWQAMQHVIAVCEADPDCGAAYPDLEGTLIDAIYRLEYEEDAELYGLDVFNGIVQALYVADLTVGLIPRVIADAANGDFDAFYAMEETTSQNFSMRGTASQADGEGLDDAEGMFNSVTCRDEYAFGSLDAAAGFAGGIIPADLMDVLFYGAQQQMFDTCALWGVGSAAAVENQAVVSSVPVLLISGAFDPVTPPAWGDVALSTLSAGQHVVFPVAGHSYSGVNACAIDIMAGFYENPGGLVDTSCLSGEPGIEWVLPGDPLP